MVCRMCEDRKDSFLLSKTLGLHQFRLNLQLSRHILWSSDAFSVVSSVGKGGTPAVLLIFSYRFLEAIYLLRYVAEVFASSNLKVTKQNCC